VSAARALAARGAQVVIATQGEGLMERHLDAGASELLRTHMESLGVEVHTECRVRGLHTAARTVEAVELADGYRLDAEIVVLACGVRPRVGLAQAAGLDVAKGIVVDDELRTSDPYIHAVGDCAQHDGVVYGLAGPATEQADVLARILIAQDAPHDAPRYRGTRTLTRLTLNGPRTMDIATFGNPLAAPGDDVLRLADATRGAYRKVIMRGDRLVGGILLGDLASVGELARTWEGDEPLPSRAAPLHLLTVTDNGGS
jgi:assimilatory nitrate reductase electron transfer subunit